MAKKDVLCFFALTATILCLAFPTLAQQTAYGHITALQTGSLGGPPIPEVCCVGSKQMTPWQSIWTQPLSIQASPTLFRLCIRPRPHAR
jgi:hypothetical protein